MRKLIFAINTTLDGCVDHTKVIGTEGTLEYFTHLMRDVDLQVFGRKTYELMVPFWPEVAKNQSVDGFSAGIEQSLSDPFGSRGHLGDRDCGCGGRVAGD